MKDYCHILGQICHPMRSSEYCIAARCHVVITLDIPHPLCQAVYWSQLVTAWHGMNQILLILPDCIPSVLLGRIV